MKQLLKFLTCGSVDDGKSTLIGHLLFDIHDIYKDQEEALIRDSEKFNNKEIDYSLLLDGLSAEREQKITIDVAYRFFRTKKRTFIVADTPGHEEYTRNMAVGASFSELAVILVDISKGILKQTKRHTRICKMMGIEYYVYAVNKMDLVNYSEEEFLNIKKELQAFAKSLNIKNITIIPISAKEGDNLVNKSENMNWYKGKTLLKFLENVTISEEVKYSNLCMPVQRVCRPNSTFRGFQGLIKTGSIKVGDEIITLPSKEKAKIKTIYVTDKKKNEAKQGDVVTIQLNKEIDISRGNVLVKNNDFYINDKFIATLFWTDNRPLLKDESLILKLGTDETRCKIENINYKLDLDNDSRIKTTSAEKNDIISCEINLVKKIVFSSFDMNSHLGRFILIDPITNNTVAFGTISSSVNENNTNYQKIDVTRKERSLIKNQKPLCFWFTGLSASGKSTLANILEKHLYSKGYHTMLLDGDNIRLGINSDLGFSSESRKENIRRIAEISKLMNDAGLIVIASLISPYEENRKMAKEIIGDSFVEIYVSTSLETCEERDEKGLYLKAKKGEIKDFTGISSPYEIPKTPNITISNDGTIEESSKELIQRISKYL